MKAEDVTAGPLLQRRAKKRWKLQHLQFRSVTMCSTPAHAWLSAFLVRRFGLLAAAYFGTSAFFFTIGHLEEYPLMV